MTWEEWQARLDGPQAIPWLRRSIVTLVVLGVLTFLARGANGPADPVLTPTSGPAAPTTTNLPGGG